MKNKTLAFFGIATYILSILAFAEDLEENYNAPVILIVISAIATIVFTIMAAIRLWKIQKIISVLLLVSSAITFVYVIPLIKGLNSIVFIWAIIKLFKIKTNESQIIN